MEITQENENLSAKDKDAGTDSSNQEIENTPEWQLPCLQVYSNRRMSDSAKLSGNTDSDSSSCSSYRSGSPVPCFHSDSQPDGEHQTRTDSSVKGIGKPLKWPLQRLDVSSTGQMSHSEELSASSSDDSSSASSYVSGSPIPCFHAEPTGVVSQELGPIDIFCLTCQQNGKTTQAKSLCEDCCIMFCETCSEEHVATPMAAHHDVVDLGLQLAPKRICKEHKCRTEFCCKDCQKVLCLGCCILDHKQCYSLVSLDSMIPEMELVLQENYDILSSQTKHNLKSKKSEVGYIPQPYYSLSSEIGKFCQHVSRRFDQKKGEETPC